MVIALAQVGTVAEVNAAATSIAPAFPRTGAVAGDVYVAWVTVAATTVPDLPAGWIAGGVSSTSGGNAPSERIYVKVATGSEPSTQTFTHASATSRAQILRFTGVDTTTPIDGAGDTTASATATNTYTLSITTSVAGCALIALGCANAPGGTWTTPTTQGNTWTEVAETTGAVPSTGVQVNVWAGSGATGTVSLLRSTSVRGCSGMLALRPASSGTTEVVATFDTSWSVRAQVVAETPTAWAVRASVQQALTTSWAVRQAVAASWSMPWSVRAVVTRAASASWSVRQQVVQTFPTSWNVTAPTGSVVAAFPLAWSVRARVTATVSTTWGVRAAVVATTPLGWAVRAPVVTSKPLAWSARATVTRSTPIVWSTRQAVVSLQPLSWRVLVVVGELQPLDVRASLRDRQAASSLQARRVAGTLKARDVDAGVRTA